MKFFRVWLRARRWYRIAQQTRLGSLRRLARARA